MFKKFIINKKEIIRLPIPTESMPIAVDKEEIKENLIQYFIDTSIDNGCLKASEINNIIYPLEDCHVFISHSSIDKDNAKKLANWLWSNFHIKSFIDSLFWGCISDLQAEMDQKICSYNPTRRTWNYSDRNYSTAYVHMLLSNALTEMIRNTECFIFIDSNNSITIDEDGFEKDTSSPWIFHELYTVNTIQPIIPERLRKDEQSIECFNESINKALEFDVTEELLDLQVLYEKDLSEWSTWQNNKEKNVEKALNHLYEIKKQSTPHFEQLLYESLYR